MIREIKTIKWFTTPAELRRIADSFELQMKKLMVGDKLPSEVICEYSTPLAIELWLVHAQEADK